MTTTVTMGITQAAHLTHSLAERGHAGGAHLKRVTLERPDADVAATVELGDEALAVLSRMDEADGHFDGIHIRIAGAVYRVDGNVSPVCAEYRLGLTDRHAGWHRFPDDLRQELNRWMAQPDGSDPLAGTGSDGLDAARSYLALDWLVRTYTPAWLDLAGLKGEAQALRDLRRIADLDAAVAAGPVVRAAVAAVPTNKDAEYAARVARASRAGVAAVLDDALDAVKDVAWRGGWDAVAPTLAALYCSSIDLIGAMVRPAGDR